MKDLYRNLRDIIGFSVAITCIGWVLLHLFGFFLYGSIIIYESNPYILVLELVVTSIGLISYLMSFYEQKVSNQNIKKLAG
jgi:hypothetical protein